MHIWSKVKASRAEREGKLLWDLGHSFNLLSSLLRNDNALEWISIPVFFFFFYDHVLLKLGITGTFDSTDSSAITTAWTRVLKIGALFSRQQRRCWGHPERFRQWLPSVLVVWFVWGCSESNQWSMINMENSHYNHSFLWETALWLRTKPWVNKPQNCLLY